MEEDLKDLKKQVLINLATKDGALLELKKIVYDRMAILETDQNSTDEELTAGIQALKNEMANKELALAELKKIILAKESSLGEKIAASEKTQNTADDRLGARINELQKDVNSTLSLLKQGDVQLGTRIDEMRNEVASKENSLRHAIRADDDSLNSRIATVEEKLNTLPGWGTVWAASTHMLSPY